MLYTACILRGKKQKGVKLSVMNRHTRNDGRTPDDRITGRHFHVHCPWLAPSSRLLGDYYKRKTVSLEELLRLYELEINRFPKTLFVWGLAILARVTDVTIMCIEETHDVCHRGVLAKECQRRISGLTVIHR